MPSCSASDETPADALELWLVAAASLLVAGLLIAALKFEVDRMVLRLGDAARTDPLTGLFNRRGFEETFDLELERARRGGHPLSVLIGDLDRLQAGQRPLRPPRRRPRARARQRGARAREAPHRHRRPAGRRGVRADRCPRPASRPACMLAERLRAAVERRVRGEQVALTVSFGVATLPASTASRARTCSARPTTRCTRPRSWAGTAR